MVFIVFVFVLSFIFVFVIIIHHLKHRENSRLTTNLATVITSRLAGASEAHSVTHSLLTPSVSAPDFVSGIGIHVGAVVRADRIGRLGLLE